VTKIKILKVLKVKGAALHLLGNIGIVCPVGFDESYRSGSREGLRFP